MKCKDLATSKHKLPDRKSKMTSDMTPMCLQEIDRARRGHTQSTLSKHMPFRQDTGHGNKNVIIPTARAQPSHINDVKDKTGWITVQVTVVSACDPSSFVTLHQLGGYGDTQV